MCWFSLKAYRCVVALGNIGIEVCFSSMILNAKHEMHPPVFQKIIGILDEEASVPYGPNRILATDELDV